MPRLYPLSDPKAKWICDDCGTDARDEPYSWEEKGEDDIDLCRDCYASRCEDAAAEDEWRREHAAYCRSRDAAIARDEMQEGEEYD